MAKFEYDDVTKHSFKYLHGVLKDIEAGKQISILDKNKKEKIKLLPPAKNPKLKELKTKVQQGNQSVVETLVKGNLELFKTEETAYLWTKLDKSPYSTGGAGAGTDVTRWAESAVCLATAYKCKFKKDLPLDWKHFKKGGTLDKLVDMGKHDTDKELKTIFDWLHANDDWYDTSIKTAQILYDKKLSGAGVLNFHRDSSFMNSVYKVFQENLKKLNKVPKGLRIGGDKWNPGDIWITNEAQFPTAKDLPTIEKLNDYLLKQWAEADIMGVSLKKLGNNPQFHVYNLGKDKISFKFRGIKPPKSPLSSKDMYITAGAPGDINIQIRTFDYNSDIQCEIKGKNAAGGKAGFGITSFMMKEFAGTTVLGKAEIAKLDEPTKLKKISEGYKAAGFSYSVEVLKAELQKKEFVDTQKKYQQKIRDDFFVSKIQSTQIAGAIKKMADKNEGDILIGVLFSYAHSLGLKDVFKASVYGKVY